MYKSVVTSLYRICGNQLINTSKILTTNTSGNSLLNTAGNAVNSRIFVRTFLDRDDQAEEKSKWLKYNDQVFPPQGPDEEPRPAFVCHEIKNVKYSPKNMWYCAVLIRGMSVDEAFRQLKLVRKKGTTVIQQVLTEAIDMAVKQHGVEFRTNLWVAESFATKGKVIKGIRRHAKGRMGVIRYRYCNYYIRLEEGTPPDDYYCKGDRSGPALLAKWVQEMRSRKIVNSL